MKKINLAIVLFIVLVTSLFAAGNSEGGGANRGGYLSRGDYIIHPDDIKIEGYLSQYDYDYPLPEDRELNVITETGVKGDNLYLLIGLKGAKTDFEKLPPLNITFCIDRSGSMLGVMPWVKNSFYIFINSVRDGDIISLVDMNTNAQTLMPPTVIRTEEDRTNFKRLVDKIQANGSTDVYAGLRQSYLETKKNYTSGHVNRVVILTDGMHNSGEMINKDILTMAGQYNDKGINVTTVLLGINAATGLMVDLAMEGGGSSRFVSDHDEMVKIFETELDRMLIPVARAVEIELKLNEGLKFLDTWGYQNRVKGDIVHFTVPTLHNGDYETILVETEILPGFDGKVGMVDIEYTDLKNDKKNYGSVFLESPGKGELTDKSNKSLRLRRAEGILTYCRGLIDIANKTQKIYTLETDINQYADPSPQRDDVLQQIKVEVNQNLMIIVKLQDYLGVINETQKIDFYKKELEILVNYTNTFDEILTSFESNFDTSESE